MLVVTIDIGTTNSRIKVIENDKIISTAKSKIGIKDVAITGNKKKLEEELFKIIEKGLGYINKTIDDVEYFIASGMVTSNLGLVEVPYIKCPAGIEDLIKGTIKKEFQWLNNKPAFFIPGVKNNVSNINNVNNLDEIDVMRGEEVETFGIMKLCNVEGPALIILPGSHTKFVYINDENKIEKCSTTMLGEFMHALSTSTILSSSLLENLVTEIDKEYILKGMDFERNYGITKTAFYVRIMDMFLDTTSNQRANFLAGALINNDIAPYIIADIKKSYKKVFIGGSSPLKEIFKIALESLDINDITVKVVSDDISYNASSIGALLVGDRIYKNSNNNLKS
ncbi:2-dehydro-3-deoxygalactonokinase [Defluviitalea phaphyphila]|uniref:2-dehydro-3-deoxygalactonokinase n=1 Tax=Defluviitalea phaphyphila TaxID=1473580 RepID=UPI0007308309|nr:2-dehydro-3-deoxygalactonokinase [Defluviitalea phaphyphila]